MLRGTADQLALAAAEKSVAKLVVVLTWNTLRNIQNKIKRTNFVFLQGTGILQGILCFLKTIFRQMYVRILLEVDLERV